MSGRISKPNSRPGSRPFQRESREARALYIESYGVSRLFCSSCTHFGEKSCFFATGLSACNNCTRKPHRTGCDVVTMNSLSGLSSELERLRLERQGAEDELLRLQKEINDRQEGISERINRLQRLRRQEELVRTKALSILQREERLDKEEEEKTRKESEASQPFTDSFVVSPASFSGINFDLGPLSPSTEAFLASVGQGSGDENRQASTSHSGGA
ncbi:hypothetical protein F5B19DRAFT_480289 [Rostrohypoxylon terebratum]|nr:hypothetical protein F5B19DRAFT_480289 [Rostrohypoxylon terebratum]